MTAFIYVIYVRFYVVFSSNVHQCFMGCLFAISFDAQVVNELSRPETESSPRLGQVYCTYLTPEAPLTVAVSKSSHKNSR